MNFIPTKLEGCFIIEPNVIKDERGYFMESFNENTFQKGTNQKVHFVQDPTLLENMLLSYFLAKIKRNFLCQEDLLMAF